MNRSQRSTFTTGLYLDEDGGGSFEAQVGKHSQKPEEFFQIIEGLFASDVQKLELFARQARPGWTTVGNQVPGDETTLIVGTP